MSLAGLALLFLAGCGAGQATMPAPTRPTEAVAALAATSAATRDAAGTRTPWPTPTSTATPRPGEPPTATWTPVPGNPVWGIWHLLDADQDFVFELPVAWRRIASDAEGGSAYAGPGGEDRAELTVYLESAAPGMDSAGVARARLAGVPPDAILEQGSAAVAGGEGVRYVYRMGDPSAVPPTVTVGFYRTASGRALALEFRTAAGRLSDLAPQFAEIAARSRFDR